MKTELTIKEAISLGAVDGEFFTSTFFPHMARQKSPPLHRECWKLLDSEHRLINLQVFRGGAKTSLLRAYTAKRISYGQARTVLYLGKSENSAIRSIAWLKNQIDTNRLWAQSFSLTRGDKWQDVEMSIEHGVLGHKVWIMGMGITGSVRGINRDDFRPDLIILDDVIDDENAATQEQRDKVERRIYGAIKESLAPASESPDAKMAMLQTPIHAEDASNKALKDPEWRSAKFGCWTPETQDLPIDRQESAWPDRWDDETLRKEKRYALARNQGSIWYREKECKLIAPESCAFREQWLKTFEPSMLPEDGARVLVIDPVPPPSPQQIEKGLVNKDFECLHVVQRSGKDYYSVEYEMRRGHNPDWTVASMFTLLEKYDIRKILVESVAYQRTLAWLIRQAMEQRGRFWQVHEFTDMRNKYTKIIDGLNGVASAGHLYAPAGAADLRSQFRDYPNTTHDDVIETLALGVTELSGVQYDYENVANDSQVYDLAKIDYGRMCGAP